MRALRIWVVAAALALAGAAAAQTPAETAAAPNSTANVVVPANAEWFATGIAIEAGAHVRLQASPNTRWSAVEQRSIALARASVDTSVDANGYPNTSGAEGLPLPGANRGALIGRIGDNGAPFLVGLSYDSDVKDSGQLYLAMNEPAGQYGDNQGRIAVALTYTPPPAPETPAPEQAPLPVPADAVPAPIPEIATPATPSAPAAPWWPVAAVAALALAALVLIGSAFRPQTLRTADVGAPQIGTRVVNDGRASEALRVRAKR